MTRTAVGLMCLQCGQLEHAPAEPETPSAVRIERISAAPAGGSAAVGSGAIDGLRADSAGRSLIKPRIDHDRAVTAQIRPKRSRQHRPIKFAAAAVAIIAVSFTFSWLSLQSNQKTALKTTPLANLAASTTNPPPKTSAVKISAQSLQRDTTRKQDLTQLATALNVYYQQTGRYPVGNSISALLTLQTTSPPYLEQIPSDPLANSSAAGDNGYGYQYQSDGTHFKLQAKLENSHDPQARDGAFIISD